MRPYNWQFGASVQHEVLPRVSVDVGYNRRWWGNFFATVNTLVDASDYDTWTLPVPNHPICPAAGPPRPMSRSRRPPPTAVRETSRRRRRTSRRRADRVLARSRLPATARLASGVTLQGGGSTGRGVRNTCDLWRARPQLQGSNRADACDVTEPWISSFRGLASYTRSEGRRARQPTLRSTLTTASGNVASNGSALECQLPDTRTP